MTPKVRSSQFGIRKLEKVTILNYFQLNYLFSDFKKARECLHDKYGSHAEPLTGINVDAQRTMRNNLADAAAIRIVSETYKLVAATDKKVSGYEKYNGEQAMFISYGVVSFEIKNSKTTITTNSSRHFVLR